MSTLASPEEAVALFRALGTDVTVQTAQASMTATAARLVRDVLAEVDGTCSRFRDDSDLTRANRRPGRAVEVSPVLAGAVRVALQAAEQTDGLVTPTMGGQLVALGYDRTFEAIGPDDPAHLPAAPPEPGSWRRVRLEGCRLTVPAGVRLDLGATGKAYAADLAATTVADRLGVDVVVGVGGDLRAAGPGQVDWPVSITDLPGPRPDADVIARVALRSGGLATSSVLARRWGRAGQFHHLLDPRTGLPVHGPWRTVTAVGRSCVAANTASTASFVLGEAAPAWLQARSVAALLVRHDGRTVRTGGWPR